MNKPDTPPLLIKGKYVSAIDGFADAWNWLISSVLNLQVGDGLTLDWVDEHPTLSVAPKERGAFAVDFSTMTVTNCHFQLGRNGTLCAAPDRVISDGTWYVVIPHSAPSSAVVSDTPQTDADTTSIPLFRISAGEVVEDYRGMPIVPMWDNEAEGA